METAWTECSLGNSGEQVDIGASVGNPAPPSLSEQDEPGESAPVIPNPTRTRATRWGHLRLHRRHAARCHRGGPRLLPPHPTLARKRAGSGSSVLRRTWWRRHPSSTSPAICSAGTSRCGSCRRASSSTTATGRRDDRPRVARAGGTRPGAVHADRDQSRLPCARHVPGERDRAVCGIRRFRFGHVAPGHRIRDGVDGRVRRDCGGGPHRPRRQDVPREPGRPGLLNPARSPLRGRMSA